jgi:hypothetical protein
VVRLIIKPCPQTGTVPKKDDWVSVLHCPPLRTQVISMFPPKAFLDAIGSQASRLFNGETPLPRADIEAQFKSIVQSALSKLDVVSREEFDTQMVVLARTRARLEALEAKVAEMEEKLTPPASE